MASLLSLFCSVILPESHDLRMNVISGAGASRAPDAVFYRRPW
jgi:hypothetical protein